MKKTGLQAGFFHAAMHAIFKTNQKQPQQPTDS